MVHERLYSALQVYGVGTLQCVLIVHTQKVEGACMAATAAECCLHCSAPFYKREVVYVRLYSAFQVYSVGRSQRVLVCSQNLEELAWLREQLDFATAPLKTRVCACRTRT